VRAVNRAFRVSVRGRARPWAASVLLAVAGAAGAQAAPDSGALGRDLRGVLEYLEARNPELRSMALEADAVRQRSGVAGALPDPMVSMELRDVPVSEPTLSPANAGSTRYALKQTFPLGDKRGLRRGVAEAELSAAEARRSATLVELRMKAKAAYSQYWYATQAHRVTEGVRGLMVDLEQIARARYGTGLVPQQDVIKAQTEVTTIRTELVMQASERRQAAARLNGVLARPADAPLAEAEAPREIPARAFDFAGLTQTAGERNPQLAVQAAQLASASRNADLVRANRWPDLTFGVAGIQRGTRLTEYELMLEMNIPWQRDVLRANESEALAMKSAAEARREGAAAQLQGELGQNWAALDALREQAAILRDSLLPQSQLTFDSALSAYQAGRVDFGTLLDAQRQIRRTRLDLLRVQLEQQVRLAEIERIVGEDL
jgi:cobalt-zinc-cadmium efflux system outer membrane protein